jgi:hypothetical protein
MAFLKDLKYGIIIMLSHIKKNAALNVTETNIIIRILYQI